MYLDTLRRYKDRASGGVAEDINSWYQGNQKKAEWRNTFTMGSLNKIIAGAEYRIDECRCTTTRITALGTVPAR